jgi:hypothetical protein
MKAESTIRSQMTKMRTFIDANTDIGNEDQSVRDARMEAYAIEQALGWVVNKTYWAPFNIFVKEHVK